MENLTERQIEAKADMVAHAIMLLTNEIGNVFEKNNEVGKSSSQTKDAFYLLLTYTNLFNAEKFFSDQLDSTTYRIFAHRLESHFNVESHEPKRFLNWIRQVENPLQYFASEAAKIIGGKDSGAFTSLGMDLMAIYASFAEGFHEGLKRAWVLVSEYPNI